MKCPVDKIKKLYSIIISCAVNAEGGYSKVDRTQLVIKLLEEYQSDTDCPILKLKRGEKQ